MLTGVFYWLLNISVAGSLCGLAVLGLRFIKKLPRFLIYILWVLPLLRFWIPFGLPSPLSVQNLLSQVISQRAVSVEALPVEATMTNYMGSASSYAPVSFPTDRLQAVFRVGAVIWLSIAAAALLFMLVFYLLSQSEIRTAVLIRGNVYRSNRVVRPAVYGILKAKIILPEAMCADQNYVLLHEQVHVVRRDNLLRIAALTTVCVHWFNPLMWVFLRCFFTDMELACDAKVIRGLEAKQKSEYAAAILSCADNQYALTSAFGGAKARMRIQHILSYRRLTLLSALCFGALASGLVLTLITNAAK